jgi:phenylalanyl-tRNA synthetase alpha chain
MSLRRPVVLESRLVLRQCICRRGYSTSPELERQSEKISLLGKAYRIDEWTNISRPIVETLSRKLHLQRSHPIGILRDIIESKFSPGTYTRYSSFSPIVTTEQNFDSLGIPLDHPGRSRTDTYYVNSDTVLRTHTSAHQDETFRSCPTAGFLISADVFRRDAIDKSHYPAFHQMEGAMTWERVLGKALVGEIQEDTRKIASPHLEAEDLMPHFHKGNPRQVAVHSEDEAVAIASHLKRTLESVVVEIFARASLAAGKTQQEKLRVRWIDAYFPFTSPSYELEVFWEGEWLELLGCGVVRQAVLNNAGTSTGNVN